MVFLFTKTVDEKFRWRTGLLDNDSEACAMKRNGQEANFMSCAFRDLNFVRCNGCRFPPLNSSNFPGTHLMCVSCLLWHCCLSTNTDEEK